MLGLALGWVYGHVVEWMLHRYLLHGWGRRRSSFWSFHFNEHHRASRQQQYRDSIYEGHPFRWNAAGKELFGLMLLIAVHLPLLPMAPYFVLAVALSAAQYYVVHKKSHGDPEWARIHAPWHYDHHMGPNQEANWGARWDVIDRWMGTREVYAGTPRELADRERRAARASVSETASG